MINYGLHHIDQSDIKALTKVLKSQSLTNGVQVENFEKVLIDTLDAKVQLWCLVEQQHYI